MRNPSRKFAAIFLVVAMTGLSWAQVKAPDKDKDKEKASVTEIGGKTLQQWIKETYDPDPGVRENAVRTIMLFGPTGSPAAPALVDRLLDTDVSLRVNACLAIGSIDVSGPDIPKAVASLARRATEDRESIVRFHAAIALGTFGKDAKFAIPNLITASKDLASWEIRRVACYALARAGAAAKEDPLDMAAANALIYVLNKDASAHVRLEAATALGSMGRPNQLSDRKMLEEALKRGTTDRERTVQMWSAVGYMAINDEAPEIYVVAVAKFLKATELNHRIHAARALGTMASKAKSRVPDLIATLNDKQPQAVLAAAWALGQMGDDAEKALGPLKEAQERKDLDDNMKAMVKDAIDAVNGKRKKP